MSGLLLTTLWYAVPHQFFVAYFFFFSALIIDTRTDLETMLISRFTSIFIVPVGFLCAWMQWLPISLGQSIMGAFFGYLILSAIALAFYAFTKKEGIGQGDSELLALIGAFTGMPGAWIALFLGSMAGSIAGSIHLLATKSRKIPFGPFLALGAITYVLLQKQLIGLFFYR